ncbi:MAG: hypothetical protein QOK37_3704 [Thermoanaerobaculia bacterium]|jgi:hypothetical protein|nr:hypothetical protein [Thermoanaerobaculia bacterium]
MGNKMIFLHRAFLMIIVATLAQGQTPKASQDKTPAAFAIKRIEGVYKTRFANSTVHQEKFESENILEIVSYTSDKIYFRVHLEFYNAHLCDLQGIALYEDGLFVFRSSDGPETESCTLAIHPGRNGVTLEDVGGNCKVASCGARGGYQGAGFPMSSRRAIRYLKRLRASKEYTETVAEFEKASRH